MKKLIFLLAVIFTVSASPAASAAFCDELVSGWSCSTYTSDTGTASLTLKPMVNSSINSSYTVNAEAPQKTDKAIRIYAENLTADSSAGMTYMLSRADSAIGNNKYKYVTVEYDVYFACENNGTFYRFRQNTDSGNTNPINIYAGTGTTCMSSNTQNVISVNDLEPHKWYKIAMVIGADGSNNVCELFVNGVSKATGTLTSGAYGISSTAPNSYFSAAASKGTDMDIYLDNIKLYAGSCAYSCEGIASITDYTSDSGFTINTDTNVITPDSASVTVADFKNAVTLSDVDAEIIALSSASSALCDTDLLCNCGYIAVLNSDGVWNYYSVDSKLKVDYYGLIPEVMYTYSGDKTLRVYTNMKNPLKNENTDFTTAVCFYDEDCKLVKLSDNPEKTTADTEKMYTYDIAIPDSAEKFSIMVWDSITSMKPIIASTEKISIDDRLILVLKFDDLIFSESSASKFSQWLGLLDKYGIHGTAGAIAKSFDDADMTSSTNKELAETMQGWIASGHEIWCHGYTTSSEFGDAYYKNEDGTMPDDEYIQEQHKAILDKSFAAVKNAIGYDMHSIGTPNNANSENALKVFNSYPAITSTMLMSDANNTLNVFNFARNRQITAEFTVNGGARVLSDRFITSFNTLITGRTKDIYAITQMHPTWKNDEDFENFKEIMKFLLTQNVYFMTPSEYIKYIGY